MSDIDKKRAEIREGLLEILQLHGMDVLGSVATEGDIYNYLHSQGVVIKRDDIRYITAMKYGNGFIDTVSVEPLIDKVICDDLPKGDFTPIENPDFEKTDSW